MFSAMQWHRVLSNIHAAVSRFQKKRDVMCALPVFTHLVWSPRVDASGVFFRFCQRGESRAFDSPDAVHVAFPLLQ